MNTFNLNLDLDKRFTNEPVRLRQGDRNGTAIQAKIYDHGTLLSGSYTARFVMLLPDREHYYRKSATYADGVATLTIDETQAASVVGTTDVAYFQILSGSTVIASTQGFTVRILPSATANATVAESYDDAIQSAIDALETATAGIPAEVVDEVDAWLAAHPEATTTVQDNSVTDAKLVRTGGVLDSVARLVESVLTRTTGPAYVHTATDATPVLAGLTVHGESTQDGTPTPDAPVAIESVGPDSDGGVVLRATTRNVAGPPIALGVTGNAQSGFTFNANGTGFVVPVAPNSTVTLALTTVGGANKFRVFLLPGEAEPGARFDGSVVSQPYNADNPIEGYSQTFQTGKYGWVALIAATSSVGYDPTIRATLNYGSTALPYVDSDAVTVSIDLQGRSMRSLSNGTHDALTIDASGHKTLTVRVGSVDMGSMSFAWLASTEYFYSDSLVGEKPAGAIDILCSGFAVTSASTAAAMADGECRGSANNGRCFFKWATYAGDAAAFKSAVSGMELLYELATPVTIDLGYITPASLPSPDLTAAIVPTAPSILTVGRDPVAGFTRLAANLAPTESSPAAANHAVGSLLTLDGQLVKVTRAIAVGEVVSIGTNVASTDVASELAALA